MSAPTGERVAEMIRQIRERHDEIEEHEHGRVEIHYGAAHVVLSVLKQGKRVKVPHRGSPVRPSEPLPVKPPEAPAVQPSETL